MLTYRGILQKNYIDLIPSIIKKTDNLKSFEICRSDGKAEIYLEMVGGGGGREDGGVPPAAGGGREGGTKRRGGGGEGAGIDGVGRGEGG